MGIFKAPSQSERRECAVSVMASTSLADAPRKQRISMDSDESELESLDGDSSTDTEDDGDSSDFSSDGGKCIKPPQNINGCPPASFSFS
ncbi:hypothetical protein HPB50_002526 [Hyalomma asiaticum]|uniref:Uncharacterized protein n=1 Tax=Hyalomma asiaticum TaxID=266040 RepID=A0ACB7T9V2_HYAAI|nr:hypothetical protein HPB50_002526 [Hyalomma asiaticum]